MSDEVKYPQIHVKLVGEDGNSFCILARCMEAMRRARISQEERDAFYKEATSGNRAHLIATCLKWFDVE